MLRVGAKVRVKEQPNVDSPVRGQTGTIVSVQTDSVFVVALDNLLITSTFSADELEEINAKVS